MSLRFLAIYQIDFTNPPTIRLLESYFHKFATFQLRNYEENLIYSAVLQLFKVRINLNRNMYWVIRDSKPNFMTRKLCIHTYITGTQKQFHFNLDHIIFKRNKY